MRRFATWLALVALLAGGCAMVGSEGADRDGAWKASYDALAKDPSAEAALRRARLAYEALKWHPSRVDRLQLDPDTLAHDGLVSLYRALVAHPEWQDAWQLFGQWRGYLGERFDAAGASEAVCPAADRVRSYSKLRLCGDLLEQGGRPAEAIARWRALLPAARSAPERNGLIVRIEHASLQPSVDLAGLSPTDIQVANAWAQSREQAEAAAQQAAHAEEVCLAQCSLQYTTCLNAAQAGAGFFSHHDCDIASEGCESSCHSYER
ncbi:MAG: hypothetical protein ACYDCL_16645 [Myxococcales bacterium]